MIYLVTGGSGSGKSEYAESLLLKSSCAARYYVATMAIYGEEGKRKVLRHQMLRREKGFITLERQRGVGAELPGNTRRRRTDSAVLLECVSNLAANEMFGSGDTGVPAAEVLAGRIVEDISRLASQTRHMVIVTNEVGSDGILYEPETMEYIRLMGLINQNLAEMAHQVTEVVYGIPIIWKGTV